MYVQKIIQDQSHIRKDTCEKHKFQLSHITAAMKLFCFFIACFAFVSIIDGYKVLGVLPFGSNSHFAIGHSIVKSLLNAGNEVTVISPFPRKTLMKNYRDVSIKDILDKHLEGILNLIDTKTLIA